MSAFAPRLVKAGLEPRGPAVRKAGNTGLNWFHPGSQVLDLGAFVTLITLLNYVYVFEPGSHCTGS